MKKLSKYFRSQEGQIPLTRREIIELWSKQEEEHLDAPCCPNCRDILFDSDNGLECHNILCSHGMTWFTEADS